MSANHKDSKVSSLRDVEAAYLLNALKQNIRTGRKPPDKLVFIKVPL